MNDAEHALSTAVRHLGAGEVDQAIDWYARAARTGNPQAKLTHGLLERAHQGDPTATHVFGVMMHQGGNMQQAIRWFKASAAAGNAEAMHDLGATYEQQNDPDSALHWYTKATRAGHSDAMLGVLRVLGEIPAVLDWLGPELEADNQVARKFLRQLRGSA